jgi:hypothetical protein
VIRILVLCVLEVDYGENVVIAEVKTRLQSRWQVCRSVRRRSRSRLGGTLGLLLEETAD